MINQDYFILGCKLLAQVGILKDEYRSILKPNYIARFGDHGILNKH